MSNFKLVRTLDDLATLNEDEIIEGYLSSGRGDPEPGKNRGRAFWHGWRNRMIDLGELPSDDASAVLAHAYVESMKPSEKGTDRG